MVQKFMVEKSGVEKFMVEKSGVERSAVEKSGVEMSFNLLNIWPILMCRKSRATFLYQVANKIPVQLLVYEIGGPE